MNVYQQNSLKDALIAAVTLNIFNKHSDRVRMANIAQMVNVLQAVLLTKGEKMVKTPTYYAFKLYNVHQDATLVDSIIEAGESVCKGDSIPKLSESASVDKDGNLHITLCNIDPNEGETVECDLRGMKATEINAEIIESELMNDYNDFDKDEKVFIKPFNGIEKTETGFKVNLPKRCVVGITVKG